MLTRVWLCISLETPWMHCSPTSLSLTWRIHILWKRPCTLWRPGALRRSQPVRIRDSAPDPRYCPSPGCELRRRRQALLPALRPVPRLRLPVRVLVVFPAVPGNHPHCSRRTGRCHHSCGSRDGLRGRSRWSASRQRPGSASVQCLRPCDPCTVPRRHGASSS